MMTSLLLLHLASAPVAPEAREELRVRAGVHFAVAAGFSGFARGIGPGFSAELGATFADRYSLVVRVTIGTILIVGVSTVGIGFDVALSEQWSLGGAVSGGLVGGVIDLPFSLAVFAPLRLVFTPGLRPEEQRGRKGLSLFAEVGPGYGLVMGAGHTLVQPPRPSPLSIEAAIGVGYAWW
jgi:hypothetical protein